MLHAFLAYLDMGSTINKLKKYVEEAKKKGADAVVFGESYIQGFPIWNLIYPPIDQHYMMKKLYKNAVKVPGFTNESLAF